MSGAETADKRTRQVTIDDDSVVEEEEIQLTSPLAHSTPGTAKAPAAAPGQGPQDGVLGADPDDRLDDLDAEDDEDEETATYRDVAAKAANKWVLLVTLKGGNRLVQGKVKDRQDPSKSQPGSWDAFRQG